MIVIGCDPDLHDTAFAVVEDSRCIAVRLARTASGLTGERAVVSMAREASSVLRGLLGEYPDVSRIVVEGQQIYQKTRVRPGDILKLAQVAGSVVGVACGFCGDVRMPSPSGWKGSVPKMVKHKRILRDVGWRYEETPARVTPLDVGFEVDFPPSKWTHAIDAVGLAVWGATRRR